METLIFIIGAPLLLGMMYEIVNDKYNFESRQ